MKLYSIILLFAGGFLAYWVKKRRFSRINQYGVEEFKSFGDKVVASSLEKAIWWVALLCILIGTILILL